MVMSRQIGFLRRGRNFFTKFRKIEFAQRRIGMGRALDKDQEWFFNDALHEKYDVLPNVDWTWEVVCADEHNSSRHNTVISSVQATCDPGVTDLCSALVANGLSHGSAKVTGVIQDKAQPESLHARFAHDLRSMLATIIVYADLLRTDATSWAEREHLEVITRAGEHMLEMAAQLDQSSMEAAHAGGRLDHCDLNALVSDVNDMLHRMQKMRR
jgi:hypothetical protein